MELFLFLQLQIYKSFALLFYFLNFSTSKLNYNNENQLTKIEIRQFRLNGEEAATLLNLFEYNDDGSLKTIIKTALSNADYREIIYPKKR